MVKKLNKSGATEAKSSRKIAGGMAGLLDTQLANSVKDSAQQIWLAGMGAFSKAQNDGTKVFEALINEGMKLQRKTQGMAEEKISEVTGRMTSMAGDVSAKAGQHWDKLEAIFEQRTAKAMGKLGVPTAKDVATLSARVDELAAAVAKLAKGAAPAKAARAAAKPAVKAKAKATTARRAAPRKAAA